MTRPLVTPKAETRAAPRCEELPPGLDWQSFSERCFPNGEGHDLDAVVAYFAYHGFRAEPPRNRATGEAEEVWEDDGGSAPGTLPR